VDVDPAEVRHGTIAGDLERLFPPEDHARDIFLFHTPPYGTALDRAALDGRSIDHAPLDVHVGSVAVRRFIEARRPLVTLHGHVHESARLTGSWRERLGPTWCFGAAHEGPELALVRFDPARPEDAVRDLR
jgi:Icc-related predicted phosphoesterase